MPAAAEGGAARTRCVSQPDSAMPRAPAPEKMGRRQAPRDARARRPREFIIVSRPCLIVRCTVSSVRCVCSQVIHSHIRFTHHTAPHHGSMHQHIGSFARPEADRKRERESRAARPAPRRDRGGRQGVSPWVPGAAASAARAPRRAPARQSQRVQPASGSHAGLPTATWPRGASANSSSRDSHKHAAGATFRTPHTDTRTASSKHTGEEPRHSAPPHETLHCTHAPTLRAREGAHSLPRPPHRPQPKSCDAALISPAPRSPV